MADRGVAGAGGISGAAAATAGVPGMPADIRTTDPFVREVVPFPVLDPAGEPYDHPFLGGFDVPRPQFADADGDGDLDLFIQERTDELIHFENVGTAAEPSFRWRTDRFMELPVGEWSRFHDVDGDGDLDLLAEAPFSYIRYFRNDGTASAPAFTFAADTVRDSSGGAVFSDRQNIPNLTDIDCDGRVDLFLGRVDGTVSRFEAPGPVSPGGVPVFDLVDARFEDIEIVAAIAVPGGEDFGTGGAVSREGSGQRPDPRGASARHGANSMAFADVDGDGDQDFFWGDFFEAGLLWIENLGTCALPDLRSEPEPVPADELIRTSGYNSPAIGDLDADGDADILIGVLGGAFNPNTTSSDNLIYLERLPSGLVTRRTSRFLGNVDLGSESSPAFGDLDGDGDLDLLVGSKLDPAVLSRARLYRFENVGTATDPRFALRDTLDVLDTYHLAPELADLDGDGDLDLVLGTWNQQVRVLENTGSATAPRFEARSAEPMATLPRGSHSQTALGDLDGDGDLDLLVGESSGEINYFRNDGSTAEPVFELVTESIDDIDVGRRSAPFLVDLDGDGDLDLLVGSEEGGARVFVNEGDARAPVYVEGEPLAELPGFSTPRLLDVDGDGDLDLLSGGMGGGLVFLRNRR